MDVATQRKSLWSVGFIYLLTISFVNASAFGIITPQIPSYLTSLGAPLALAGTVTGLFSITALLARPLASILGDRLNKKWLLMVSMAITGIAVFFYAVTPGIAWMIPVRILHGIAFSISGTVSLALGTDFIPKERLGEGVGYLGIGQIIGMAIGPNIGIYLMEIFTYQFCFALSGIVITIAGLSLVALHYKPAVLAPSNNTQGSKKTFHIHDLVAIALLPNAFFVAVLALSNGLNNSYLVMVGKERGIGSIGFFFIVNAAVILLVRPIIGKMIDRRSVSYAILPGFILAAAAMIIIGISHNLWPILFAAVLVAVGAGGALPAIQTDCLKRVDVSRRTVATGTYLIGMDIGISSGQILGGVFTDSFGFGVTYFGAGVLMLIGFGLYILYNKFMKQREAAVSVE